MIYVIGPVTGKQDNNKAAFEAAAEKVERATGAQVTIPHDVIPGDATWRQAMRMSIAAMMDADLVVRLPGWEDSRGASMEAVICESVGIRMRDLTYYEEERL